MVLYFAVGILAASCVLNSITLMKIRMEQDRIFQEISMLLENAKFLNDQQHKNLERFSGVYDLINTLAGIEKNKSDKTE